jgi:protein-tyrosine phosphatase
VQVFNQVYEDIYVGEIDALKRQTVVRNEGITVIVRLDQAERQEGQWDDDFTLLDMPIPDGEYLDGDTIDTVTSFINEHVEAGHKILVHCQMGISRSVSMVMAYLIAYESMSLAEAFGTLRESRDAAYPHEMLLISLIDHYDLPYDTSRVRNPQFLARLAKDA